MSDDDSKVGAAFIQNARQTLEDCLKKIDHCFAQIGEEDTWWRPFPQANSIGNIVLHLCGNIGQWIISGIGGAPDVRQRPQEFAQRDPIPKSSLSRRLMEVVETADRALANFPPEQLLKTRHIQHWDVTALSAIFDSVGHFVGHTQQIVYITRLRIGDRYKFLGLDAKSD